MKGGGQPEQFFAATPPWEAKKLLFKMSMVNPKKGKLQTKLMFRLFFSGGFLQQGDCCEGRGSWRRLYVFWPPSGTSGTPKMDGVLV